MIITWVIGNADHRRLDWLAGILALKLAPGDFVTLGGDLGAGKTTLARAIVRAVLSDPTHEVPSPTFGLVQHYTGARMAIAHFDLYRLSGAEDLAEIGFDDALDGSLTLVEWAERAEDLLPADRLEIELSPGAGPELRRIELRGLGTMGHRLGRMKSIGLFLDQSLAREMIADLVYLQGDASSRGYARVRSGDRSLVLMDAPRMPDGPPVRDGLPYSRLAHLAEDVAPFVAIGTALARSGLSVPQIEAADLDAGLLLLEDLGDLTFARALAAGADQRQLWLAALDALVALRRNPMPQEMPLPNGATYKLPHFDRRALEIEIGLLLDWFWPAERGAACPQPARDAFQAAWAPILDRMLAAPAGVFLRDYHSPNLFWLPERTGAQRVGVIDFQDALSASWAYDVASLLQDARVDVSTDLEAEGLDYYCAHVAAREADFDESAFRTDYAVFGMQRNIRLAGLWIRLRDRDGKPGYIRHMPRTWDYIRRNLASPVLVDIRRWLERHFPDRL